jgi:hypothetical protein
MMLTSGLLIVLVVLVWLPTTLGATSTAASTHLRRTLLGSKTFAIPFTASPFKASAHHESGPKDAQGNCNRPGFDAQRTQDKLCRKIDQCHLGWTEPGDFVMYEFTVTKDDIVWDYYNGEEAVFVDVVVRVASANPNRRIRLQIGNDVDSAKEKWPSMTLKTPGLSMQNFQDVTWHNVRLSTNLLLHHRLYVRFLDGGVNLCAVTVKPSRIAPFRAPALDFDYYLERDGKNYFNSDVCGADKQGLVDARPTSDTLCQQRDGSSCNIGWTYAGEYAYYDFDTIDSEDYRVWVRMASLRTDKIVRVELQDRYKPDFDFNEQPHSFEFSAPGLGWQNFVDFDFTIYLGDGHFRLVVVFVDGDVNLCSVGVEYMVHWSIGEYEIPITFNALEYDYALDSNPEEVRGDCPERVAHPETDSKKSQDKACLTTGPCYVAFTEPGEILRYDFATETKFDEPRHGRTGPIVDIVLRVASKKTSKRIIVEVDGNRKTFTTPGLGLDSFGNIVWKGVQLRNFFYHPLYVVFEDGSVNLCSVTVK